MGAYGTLAGNTTDNKRQIRGLETPSMHSAPL